MEGVFKGTFSGVPSVGAVLPSGNSHVDMKEGTIKARYRAILEGKGVDLDECKILAFFIEKPESFHYRLMESGIRYFIFDCFRDDAGRMVAQVVIPREGADNFILFATMHDGERTTLYLTE